MIFLRLQQTSLSTWPGKSSIPLVKNNLRKKPLNFPEMKKLGKFVLNVKSEI